MVALFQNDRPGLDAPRRRDCGRDRGRLGAPLARPEPRQAAGEADQTEEGNPGCHVAGSPVVLVLAPGG